ncbi:MAG: hypothetical protein AAF802_07615 [Planctomycetota bacterium]
MTRSLISVAILGFLPVSVLSQTPPSEIQPSPVQAVIAEEKERAATGFETEKQPVLRSSIKTTSFPRYELKISNVEFPVNRTVGIEQCGFYCPESTTRNAPADAGARLAIAHARIAQLQQKVDLLSAKVSQQNHPLTVQHPATSGSKSIKVSDKVLGLYEHYTKVLGEPRTQSCTEKVASGFPGRFCIETEVWEQPILLDTATGQMWTLTESTNLVDARMVAWTSMKRISSQAEIEAWEEECRVRHSKYIASLKAISLAHLEERAGILGRNHPKVVEMRKSIEGHELFKNITDEQLEDARKNADAPRQ